ncbi:MAG: thiamine biosynthesis protein ThiS [Pseudomonadota bacterium]|jgi:sulfur carrier protein
MNIFINGEESVVEDNISVKNLLEHLGVTQKVMAVAVNSNIVRKDGWELHNLSENDKVELLQFTGGGA